MESRAASSANPTQDKGFGQVAKGTSPGRRKDALLRSGLPLENVVARLLKDAGCDVWGEFAYVRTNENGVQTEFSVDTHAVGFLQDRRHGLWATLELLVECKYCYPGSSWVFVRHQSDTSLTSDVTTCVQSVCVRQLADLTPLSDAQGKIPRCTKGIVLHDNGPDTKTVYEGLSQLRYAMPAAISLNF